MAKIGSHQIEAIQLPEEAHRIFGEVLGKKDMVEEIKAWCEEILSRRYIGTGSHAHGQKYILKKTLTLIKRLQKENQKCQTSRKKHGKV